MPTRVLVSLMIPAAALVLSTGTQAQTRTWNNPGTVPDEAQAASEAGPAPRRDLTGLWAAGRAGIGARGHETAPLTPWGEEVGRTHRSGDGIRMVPIDQINDPLSIMADPARGSRGRSCSSYGRFRLCTRRTRC